MYLGDQWSPKEKEIFSQYNRAGYIFNRLKRVVKIVSGYERKNRLSLKIGAEGNEDDLAANQLSKIIMRTMTRRGYGLLSECFKWGSLVTGMNLLWMMRDSFGDISFNRSPHNETMLDPGFVNRDLSDCGYILRGKWIAGRDMLNLFPVRRKPPAGTWAGCGGMWQRRNDGASTQSIWSKNTGSRPPETV
jgi:hypothetical protein